MNIACRSTQNAERIKRFLRLHIVIKPLIKNKHNKSFIMWKRNSFKISLQIWLLSNRYRTHFASHAPPKNRHGGLFTPHRKLAQGLSLTMNPTKTASLLWKFSPLGIFWAFLRKVFKNSAKCTLCVIKGMWWFTIFPWRVHRRK